MRALSRLGVGLTAVSALLLLALAAELYYILVHRRRRRAAAVSDAVSSASPSSSSRELLHLFCFKKPPPAATTYAQDPRAGGDAEAAVAEEDEEEEDDEDESVEAQLMRLGSLVGPPRLLFTIKEETREDLESDDGRSRSRSLADLLHCSPLFLTPAASPSVPPPFVESSSFNPLFESPAAPSPPPNLQFLKDAEEKLFRRALAEEAKRARRSPTPSPAAGDEDGGFITIVVGKNTRVIPLPPSP